jgi:hypothetical protein
VFDSDSVTNIAHQLGYFETIATSTVHDRAGADRGGDARAGGAAAVRADSRTARGWFVPLPVRVVGASTYVCPVRAERPRTRLEEPMSSTPHTSDPLQTSAGGAEPVAHGARQRRGAPDQATQRRPRSRSAWRCARLGADPPAGRARRGCCRASSIAARDAHAADIAEELDSRGITLSIGVTRHLFSLVCTCLADDFEPVLSLLGEMLISPSLPGDEIATRKREVITSIRQDDDNPAVRASETLMALLYPNDHPYGRRTKGSIDIVERLTRDDLVRQHAARFAPSELTAVVVGMSTPAARPRWPPASSAGGASRRRRPCTCLRWFRRRRGIASSSR